MSDIKYSQKLWNEKMTVLKKSDLIILEISFKKTYDEILSLEAKIEAVDKLIEIYEYPSMANDLPKWTTNTMHTLKDDYIKELSELAKKHNLK